MIPFQTHRLTDNKARAAAARSPGRTEQSAALRSAWRCRDKVRGRYGWESRRAGVRPWETLWFEELGGHPVRSELLKAFEWG